MDSTNFDYGSDSADSDIAKDDEEITYLVNANIYKQWRSQYVDEIELSVWNIDMVKFSIANTFENYGPIRTAIRRGVPDIIKHYIWIKANDADRLYIENPEFYKHSFSSTFGNKVPSELGDYCPTFSGGILGFQADLLDSPLVLDHLHHQISQSLDTEVLYDSESEYNYWSYPYQPGSLNEPSSPLNRSASNSGKGFKRMYSNILKMFRRRNTLRGHENTLSSYNSGTYQVSLAHAGSYKDNLNDTPNLDSYTSFYTVQGSDFTQTNTPDRTNRERLIDYIHLLNHENLNKRELMKSALRRIRRGTFDTKPFSRNLEKSRQMSDTFIYNTKYTYFPPPPSHHSKLIQSNSDSNFPFPQDNPFHNTFKQKNRCIRLFCFPVLCSSKRKHGHFLKNPFFYAPRQSAHFQNQSAHFDYPLSSEHINLTSPTKMDLDPPLDREGINDNLKRYNSETMVHNYVKRYSTTNRLPMINTIPEDSPTNSINYSNIKEPGYTDSPRHDLEDNTGSAELKNSISPSSIKENALLSSEDSGKLNDGVYFDYSISLDPNYKDLELVNKLSADFTKKLSSTSVDGSAYKLTDVTDFTVLLTCDGVLEVKRILWCLNSYFSNKIEFLPIIPSLCCLLLIYLSPNAVLCLLYKFMKKCLETSNLDCGDRFFFVDRKGFVRFVTFILSVMVSNFRKTVLHLRNLRVDLAAWVARTVQTGFSQILPFDYIVRIYGNFLFEGEMVLCRYSVALIRCIRNKLLNCTTKYEAEQLLYHIGLDNSIEIDEVTKIAFSLRIKKFDKKIGSLDTPSPYLMNVKIRNFYRPRLHSTSLIVTVTNWESIWARIKPTYRILDPQNLYSSNVHGTSMNGLIKRLTEHGKSSSPALLFIKTTKPNIFGVFIPNLLNTPVKGYFTPQEAICQMDSFIFTLFPYEMVYPFTGKNSTGVKISRDNIIIGANDPAIILDGTLSTGVSAKSDSFDSPPLVTGNKFNVHLIEIWILC